MWGLRWSASWKNKHNEWALLSVHRWLWQVSWNTHAIPRKFSLREKEVRVTHKEINAIARIAIAWRSKKSNITMGQGRKLVFSSHDSFWGQTNSRHLFSKSVMVFENYPEKFFASLESLVPEFHLYFAQENVILILKYQWYFPEHNSSLASAEIALPLDVSSVSRVAESLHNKTPIA